MFMKRSSAVLLAVCMLLGVFQVADAAKAKKEAKGVSFQPFYIYSEEGSAGNHYTPSGWMGDISDLGIDGRCKDKPFKGETCLKITYSSKGQQGWAGIYWQEPPNNWGTMKGGFNLTGAKKFVMYIRGSKGGERIGGFSVGGVMSGGVSSDTDKVTLNPMVLTKEWQKVEVDLTGKNMGNIISGLSFSIGRGDNPEGAIFYLDEVRFE
jgi:hypothetical protein